MLKHFWLLLLLISPATFAAGWSAPEYAGTKTDIDLEEMSGMAASKQHKNLLWVINDGGNGEKLVAMKTDASRVATFNLKGVKNVDWEDIARFELNGKHYLLIADTGDNGGIRKTLQLYVFEEPKLLKDDQTLSPAWTIDFKWPDGARDCEAVTVDSSNQEILLISKKRVPPELFSLPLQPKTKDLTATFVGHLLGIPQPTAAQLKDNPVYGRYRSQITAVDLSPNGRVLMAMNYHSLFFYIRDKQQNWAIALKEMPESLSFPWLPQAEAVSFSAEGNAIYIGSEQRPVPIIRYKLVR
jgi:hypothetical protein